MRLTTNERQVLTAFRSVPGRRCFTATDIQGKTHLHPARLHCALTELGEQGLIDTRTALSASPDDNTTYYALTEIGKSIT